MEGRRKENLKSKSRPPLFVAAVSMSGNRNVQRGLLLIRNTGRRAQSASAMQAGLGRVEPVATYLPRWLRSSNLELKANGTPYKTSKARRKYERRYYKKNPPTQRRLARRAYPVSKTCQVKGCNELGERHHEDWRKPLDIVWLCYKHHVQWHNSLQTLGEIQEYGEFTLEEFLQGKSKEEWLKERLEERRKIRLASELGTS